MKLVYMFPGQNSRYPEMMERLGHWSGRDHILHAASDALGRDLSGWYRQDNSGMFSHNRDVQVGVFLASYILTQWLAAEGLQSDASLGLSLGEYNHLVEIGALSFSDALRLLDARGSAYEHGPRGLMMSVFPCDAATIAEARNAAASVGPVDIGIHLSNNHFVLSGAREPVEAAAAWAEEEAFAQARVVDSALPMHSRFFKPAADAFAAALETVHWQQPRQPYIPNVDGVPLENATAADFKDRLRRHIFNTVRWAESLAELVRRFPDAAFIEVGPKCVLYNSVRREYKEIKSFRVDDPEAQQIILPETVRLLQEEHSAA